MKVTAKVTGFKELEAALANIEKAATRKTVARNALKKAGAPIAEAMRAKAPKDSHRLANNIVVGTKLKNNVGDAAYAKAMRAKMGQAAAVMAKRDALRAAKGTRPPVVLFVGPGADIFYAHLVEFGTAPHINGGKFAGSQHKGTAPQPFIRPAWDAEKEKSLQRISDELRAEIMKAAARQAKRRAKNG